MGTLEGATARLRVLVCAACVAGANGQDSARLSGRLVDPAGNAIPAGTMLQARVEWWGALPAGFQYPFAPIGVGPNGSFTFTPKRAYGLGPNARPGAWLHITGRIGWSGPRERVFTPVTDPGGDMGTLVLQVEERLASGPVVDSLGTPVPVHAYSIDLRSAPLARRQRARSSYRPQKCASSSARAEPSPTEPTRRHGRARASP